MQLAAVMRLKDATFASRREAAFHAFLQKSTRVETRRDKSLRIIQHDSDLP